MNEMFEHFGSLIRKLIARSIETPQLYLHSAWTATLSIAETLLALVDSRLVPDIRRIKEANIQAIEAHTQKKQAEANLKTAAAQKKLSEAAHAANQATLHKRKDAIARAERDRLAAEAAKTQAEAEAIRMDAETRRIAAVADARAKFLESISRLRQEGGEFFANPENLERILKIEAPTKQPESPEG